MIKRKRENNNRETKERKKGRKQKKVGRRNKKDFYGVAVRGQVK